MTYNIKFFNIIKIIGGEIGLLKEGIIIHLTKRRATIVEYNDILSLRKKFEPVKDFHFISFISKVKIGAIDNYLELIKVGYFYEVFTNLVEQIIKKYKPYLNLSNNICIYDDRDFFEFSCRVDLVFNLLVVLISLVKIFLEKRIYAIKRRAKQN